MVVAVTLYLNGFGDGLSAQASSVPLATAVSNAAMRVFGVVFIILLVGALRRTFDQERANALIAPLATGVIRYVALVLFVRGTFAMMFGWGPVIGMLSVSQFFLQDLVMAMLIPVAWPRFTRHRAAL